MVNSALLKKITLNFLMIRRPPRSTQSRSSAASDVYKRQGVSLIKEGMGILTHCNAGALATTGIGTATAPMYLAHENGVQFCVYADETRPLLQGARLTSWELNKAGLDVTLITDNMVAHIMSQGLIDLVITGTDRVAANGDLSLIHISEPTRPY